MIQDLIVVAAVRIIELQIYARQVTFKEMIQEQTRPSDNDGLKQLGYDLVRIASRAAEIDMIEVNDIFLKGKLQKRG